MGNSLPFYLSKQRDYFFGKNRCISWLRIILYPGWCLRIGFLLAIFLISKTESFAQDFKKDFADSLNPLYETKLIRLAEIYAEKNDSVNFFKISNKYLKKYSAKTQLNAFLFDHFIYDYTNTVWQKQKEMAINEVLASLPPEIDKASYTKLLLIDAEDQAIRIHELASKGEFDSIDLRHLSVIKEIIKRGKDSKKYLADDGMHIMFLVILHIHDQKVQKSYSDTLRRWYKFGDLRSDDYISFVDKVLLREGKKQLYATQYYVNGDNIIFYPIDDMANLDKRRKYMHAQPINYNIAVLEMVEKKTALFGPKADSINKTHPFPDY